MADPVVATYSIVACDVAAGQWGVAVQSKFLAVGAVVPWAEPRVGAVATQADANPRYGPDGLALLRDGLPADEVVRRLTEADERRAERQLGVVDANGGSATYTGEGCLDWAGGIAGVGFAAQGNILVGEETVQALARTFTDTTGLPLAQRLLECLAAAEAAGGDRRGRQSASLLVVERGGGYGSLSDSLVDLRVDDHAEPIVELARIFEVHQRLFGRTPEEDWVEVTRDLRAELEQRLRALGYTGSLDEMLHAWSGTENLEERVRGADRIDPVVLEELRAQ
jgi:uncharacterized Ntn-hydrolase superfamily protein